ncbi:MAG: PIN/TRAM domain-containing protein [Planctomycetota bacterium]|nr:MAG: PIN/TRAM domain-containing protein [Planctomycetota bacterium]
MTEQQTTQPGPERAPARPDVPDPFSSVDHGRVVLVRIVRIGFVVLFFAVTLLSIVGVQSDSAEAEIRWAIAYPVILLIAGAVVAVVLLIDYLTPKKKISTLFSILIGLLGAVAASIAAGFVIDLLLETWINDANSRAAIAPIVSTIKVLLGIILAYLAITTVLQTQDDFRLVIPYVEFAKQIRGIRPLLLDSSVLIDGRIYDVCRTGFIQAPLVIPHFVIAELQTLADSSDKHKRARGRRGLDTIATLQRSPEFDVSIEQTPVPGKAVDQMLVELAKSMPAVIATTDSGLVRVAAIQGVRTVNLNDLAFALKPPVVTGQELSIEVVRPGEQPGQGVGFLEDGTMVVIENGAEAVGSEISVVVTSTLQTSAGRMVFARQQVAEADQQVEEPGSDDDQPAQPRTPARGPRHSGARGRNPRR